MVKFISSGVTSCYNSTLPRYKHMSNDTFDSGPCTPSRHTRLIRDRELRRLNKSSLFADDVRDTDMVEDELSRVPWLTDGGHYGHVNEELSEQVKQRILVVANRLPVSATRKGEDVWHLDVSVGGLVSALIGLKQYDSQWIGWAGVDVTDEVGKNALTEALAGKKCIPVFLDQETVDQYYNGYCNNMLWPLFHYLGLPQEDGLVITRSFEAQFNAYKRANKLFADVVIKHYQPGDIVWCHDYHLMFLPKFLKEHDSNMKVGWFLHTPFPSSEIHRMLPSRSELLRSVLEADLVGFHTYDYARHFVSACTRILGLEGTPIGVEDQGKLARVAAFPIGIDPDRFIKALERPQVQEKMKELKERFAGRKLILGVDRLDMIKGIPHKILAFEKFLEENPDWRDKVVLLQIAVPTRTDVSEYRKLTSLVHKTVGRINGRFGTLTAVPILHLDRTLDFDALCALYAVTDVALVTSLRDGMNLVSYEFVACQASKKGVLVLSEFAGAAQSLGAGAILVNPWNITEVADSIAYALNMPADEREKRHKINFMHVTTHTSQEWAATYISELIDAVVEAQLRTTQVPPPLPVKVAAERFSRSSNRLLILGFNATLTEPVYKLERRDGQIKELELALHPELRIPLKKLCDDPNTTVVILTGSERSVLDNNFSGYNMWLAAENGMFLRHTKGQWMTTMPENLNMDWVESVKHVFEYFTERTPRSHFELRETSVMWNYKYSDFEFGRLQARDLLQHLCTGPISSASVDVIQGGRSVEVRTVGVTKGAAMERILGEIIHNMVLQKPIDNVLCIGHFLPKDEDIYSFFEPDLPSELPPVPQVEPEPSELSGPSIFSRSKSCTAASRARYQRSLPVTEYKSGIQGSGRGWRPAVHTKKTHSEGSSVLDLKSGNYFSCAVGRKQSKARYLLSSDGVVTLLKELANLSPAQ